MNTCKKKKKNEGKSTLLIMLHSEAVGKSITVAFYIRVLSRCLSTPLPLPPRARVRLSNPVTQADALHFLASLGP